jgi:hypothetical protein
MAYNAFGWDTIYTIDIELVNGALSKCSMPKLNYDADGITMAGAFAPMRIVPGGSGKLLRISFSILSGTFTSKQNGEAALDGVQLIADLELALLPSAIPSTRNLVPRILSVSRQTGPGLLTPVNLIDSNKHLSPAQWGLVFGLLPQYLVSIADKLSFVLASVDYAKPATNSWLAPVEADYAFLSKNDGGMFLGVLAATTHRDVSGLPRTIDNEIVSGANNAGLFISEALFMQNVIMPNLPRAYSGASANTFHWNGSAIVSNQTFGAGSFQKGAITYYPQIDSFTMTVSGGNLVTQIAGHCDLKAGIGMTFNGSTTNEAVFNPQSKIVTFAADPNPQLNHDVDIPWYWAFGGLVVEGIVQLVARLIANALADSLRSGEGVTLAQSPPTSIQWSGTTPIAISVAGLNGLFYMQGTVKSV